MTDKVVVLSTAGTAKEAQKLARALVEARLAACVNIVPQIRSIYRWKGEIQDDAEFLLIIKTTRDLVAQVQLTITELHSYTVPESIALPIVDGSAAYLEWIGRETEPEGAV